MLRGESKKGAESPQVQEAQKPQSSVESLDDATHNKTKIGRRLDAALKAAKPVNRSSDLVPLNHDYDMRRRELRALIASARKYHDAIIQLEKARMDIALKYSVLATNSPIFSPIGDTLGGDSVATVVQAAFKVSNDFAASYDEKIVAYCIEWERIVTSRVDDELKDTNKLNERLNHYQTKLEGLRTKVNNMTEKGKEVPKKVSEKLTRNEKKLDQAWRAHEKSASKLCNLIEEVTVRGWKDLYPLVKASMQWEVERANGELNVLAKLPAVTDMLVEAFENSASPVLNISQVPIALADDDNDSATTGSYHPEEDDDSTINSEGAVAGDETPKTNNAPLSPAIEEGAIAFETLKAENAPLSPNAVKDV